MREVVAALFAIAAVVSNPAEFIIGDNITIRGERAGHCALTATGNSNATTIDTQNQWEEINDDLTVTHMNGCTTATSDMTVGAGLVGHSILMATAAIAGGTGKTYDFAFSVDNAIQANCMISRKLGSTDLGAIPIACMVSLVLGDVIKLEVRGIDVATANITFQEASFLVFRL